MKNIKNFNEFNSINEEISDTTIKSASDKMRSKGWDKRADRLERSAMKLYDDFKDKKIKIDKIYIIKNIKEENNSKKLNIYLRSLKLDDILYLSYDKNKDEIHLMPEYIAIETLPIDLLTFNILKKVISIFNTDTKYKNKQNFKIEGY